MFKSDSYLMIVRTRHWTLCKCASCECKYSFVSNTCINITRILVQYDQTNVRRVAWLYFLKLYLPRSKQKCVCVNKAYVHTFVLSVVKNSMVGTKLWLTNTLLNIPLHNLLTLGCSFLNNLVPCIAGPRFGLNYL